MRYFQIHQLKAPQKIPIQNPTFKKGKINLILEVNKMALKHYIMVVYKGLVYMQKQPLFYGSP